MFRRAQGKRGLGLFCWLIAATVASPVAGLHSVFLAVPNHSEEALTWCGPAVAEMVMEGYPAGACDHMQADIWAEIVANKVEVVWDTDPMGMRMALKNLCPPPGSWTIYSRADAHELMWAVAFWMTVNNFPVAAVLDTAAHNSYVAHQEHWVVIKGIITDVDPRTSSSISLEHIWFTDPAVPLGDPPDERFIAGSAWYTELQSVSKVGSAYAGNYVAVIEPPERRGRAIAKEEVFSGRIIPVEKAREYAHRWVRELEILRELKPFRELARAKPLEPLLVNPKRGGYYIVPYSLDGETAPLAVRVNAYTGDFQEVAALAPVRWVSEKEALDLALKFLSARRPERPTATLAFAPAAGSASRLHPVWRVVVDDQVVAVGQDRTVRWWPRKQREEQ